MRRRLAFLGAFLLASSSGALAQYYLNGTPPQYQNPALDSATQSDCRIVVHGQSPPSYVPVSLLLSPNAQSIAKEIAQTLKDEKVTNSDLVSASVSLNRLVDKFRRRFAERLGPSDVFSDVALYGSITVSDNLVLAGCFPDVRAVLVEFASRARAAAATAQQEAQQVAQQNLQEARQAALAKKQEFDRQAALDKSNGYQGVSVEGFALDGKELAAKRAKLAINGYYIRVGDSDFLYVNKLAVGMATRQNRQQPNVVLLTDDASREFRQLLLTCRSNPGNMFGCPVTVLGRATICALSNAFGGHREEPCVAVEDGRQSEC